MVKELLKRPIGVTMSVIAIVVLSIVADGVPARVTYARY